jgi:hypothetical protein
MPIVFIDLILTSIVSSGMRFVFGLICFPNHKGNSGERVLVVGAGDGGQLSSCANSIQATQEAIALLIIIGGLRSLV